MKCCYCKKPIRGRAEYCIPEDFPNNPVHGGKPLCSACGGFPEPTLDEICETLDMELELPKPNPIGPGGGLRVKSGKLRVKPCLSGSRTPLTL